MGGNAGIDGQLHGLHDVGEQVGDLAAALLAPLEAEDDVSVQFVLVLV